MSKNKNTNSVQEDSSQAVISEQTLSEDSTKEEAISEPTRESKTKSPKEVIFEKTYVAIYPILCNGEMIEANSVVTEEELGSDLERLIKIGAVGELLDKD